MGGLKLQRSKNEIYVGMWKVEFDVSARPAFVVSFAIPPNLFVCVNPPLT